MRYLTMALGFLFVIVCLVPAPQRAQSAPVPVSAVQQHRHPYPAYWLKAAHCIHWQEVRAPWSAGWDTHFVYGTHTESADRGGFQILVDTWASFAPGKWTRDPAQASRAQQLLVAWRIWIANGRRWGGQQWPQSAAACGLR